MRNLVVARPLKPVNTTVSLPASKSICNRALIIQKILGDFHCEVNNISTADDSVIMQHALAQTTGTVNVKNAGTCMRFLTAYYASTPGIDIVLHGDERMHRRPVAPLVDALRNLGADIDYINEEGFAPLRIKGKKLAGGIVTVDATQSSQFTSALMLAAPAFTNGLVINQGTGAVSASYARMTALLLKQCGIDVILKDDIVIRPFIMPPSHRITITIEPDWSAASYWYAIAALSPGSEIVLKGLEFHSVQGDSMLVELMKPFGVESKETAEGISLSSRSPAETPVHSRVFDMKDFPDLVPALAVIACALNRPCTFVHVAHLEVKESKRLSALCAELSGCNFDISHHGKELVINKVDMNMVKAPAYFNTYNDHRMAMAFALLSLLFNKVTINDAGVVKKSYPEYWVHLQKAGFGITNEPGKITHH